MVSFLKICKGIEQKASKSKFKYGFTKKREIPQSQVAKAKSNNTSITFRNSPLSSSLREALKVDPFFLRGTKRK